MEAVFVQNINNYHYFEERYIISFSYFLKSYHHKKLIELIII